MTRSNNNMTPELADLYQTLTTFASKASAFMQERLESILTILIKLNEQITYTNAMRAMLDGNVNNMTPATLENIRNGLEKGNETLLKFQQELPNALLLNNEALTPEQKGIAEKMHLTLNEEIQRAREENKLLLEQARIAREEKLGLGRKRKTPEPSESNEPTPNSERTSYKKK